MPTERRNRATTGLDRLSLADSVKAISRENFAAARAVERAAPATARAAAMCAACFAAGGRIIFAGAGTSGRLGMLEAAECPPTFGVEPGRITAVLAGGKAAMFRAKEGAEDSVSAGRRDIVRRARKGDCVVGISASGVTPYALGALAAARKKGCKTVFVTCNPRVAGLADVTVAAATGPEPLAGSTRMKAGSAVKMILNAITTAAMARCGKVYGNLMVDVRPMSRKLQARALGIIEELGGVTPARARALYAKAGREVKAAVVMARLKVNAETARALLAAESGHLRKVLEP